MDRIADWRGNKAAVVGNPQRLGNLPGRMVGQCDVAQLPCRTRSSRACAGWAPDSDTPLDQTLAVYDDPWSAKSESTSR